MQQDAILDTGWHEISAGVYFCGLAIFCILWEVIFAIKKNWFSLLEINLRFSESIQYPRAKEKKNTKVCVPYVKPVIHCIPFDVECKRQVVIEQTRFLSTVFLYSEF